MKILVSYGYYADVIDCPTHIADRIKELQREFDVWLNDPKNEHKSFHNYLSMKSENTNCDTLAFLINYSVIPDSSDSDFKFSSSSF